MESIYTLNQYYRERFGSKIYKLSLNGGMTCPNRDGTLGDRGCIFCSRGGSGDFAADPSLSITRQLESARRQISGKMTSGKYIAYFQAFTNTYAPVAYLRRIYTEAIAPDDIVGLSIATRPDCINDEILSLLQELRQIKPVFVELGLQTVHEDTARFIRRGYPLSVFDEIVLKLHATGLHTVVHLILGLPGEDSEDVLTSIRHINTLPVDGIKLQLLHVLKGTDLADLYLNQDGSFHILSLEEYTVLLALCIETLRPDIVIHRLTGDGSKKDLLAPLWSADKKRVLNYIHHYFKEHHIVQGGTYDNGT